MSFMTELKQKLNQLGIPASRKRKNFEGCSQSEIDSLIQGQGVSFLPETYRQFMAEMGKNAGDLFSGEACYVCEYARENKSAAIEILAENNSKLQLPSDVFVFVTWDVMLFCFFHTQPEHDNPPVYSYFTGGLEFKLAAPSFVEFLFSSVEERAKTILRVAEASKLFRQSLRQQPREEE